MFKLKVNIICGYNYIYSKYTNTDSIHLVIYIQYVLIMFIYQYKFEILNDLYLLCNVLILTI